MEFQLKTRLDGTIALTSRFHEDAGLQRNKSFYKFIWVRHGSLDIEIDHVVMHLKENEIISLSPLHHVDMLRAEGDYLSLLFNSNFYCIYGHDNEVSCNGFLFHGSSNVMRLKLNPTESRLLEHIIETLREECTVRDNLQEEMLRILLKRFIIVCTRMARLRLEVDQERENGFDIIRQFYVLVDNHFKEAGAGLCGNALPFSQDPFQPLLALRTELTAAHHTRTGGCRSPPPVALYLEERQGNQRNTGI